MISARTGLTWLLSALAAGCGARSSLYLSGGEGGAATTSSAGGAGGAGGEGGGPVEPCAELEIQPVLGLAGGAGLHQRAPELALSSDDGALVTVVAAWQVVQGPGQLPTELRHATLEPWLTWPAADIAPSYLADFDAGVSFAAGRSPGDHFALLFADFQTPPAGGARFSGDFAPGSGAVPASILVDDAAQRAVFVSRSLAGGHAMGAELRLPAGGAELFQLRLVSADTQGGAQAPVIVACAQDPLVADAIPAGGGVLVALSSAISFGDPACAGGGPAVGPAHRVQIAVVAPDFLQPGAEIFTSGVTDLRITPRSDGAWVVWAEPSDNDLPPRLLAVRVGPQGAQVGQPFNVGSVAPDGALVRPGSIAATSFDDFLVIAWIEPDSPPAIHVQVFDPGGSPRARRMITPAQIAGGRLSLLPSPSGRSALLAWSEAPASGPPGDRIRLTRLDCLDR